jgi:transposase-like protein
VTRADRRTLVRQLSEEGLSARAIAERIGVGKDTVRRDLAALERRSATQGAPSSEPRTPDAPQAGEGDPEEAAPQDAPVAQLPLRVAQPLDGMDLSQWPAVRRDLADLVRCGRTPEGLAHMAITAMAHAYRQALARGDLEPGQWFQVREMTLTPLPHRGSQVPSGPAPAEAG